MASDGTETPNVIFGELGKQMKIHVMFSNGSSVFPNKMFWDKTIMINQWIDRRRIDNNINPNELSKTNEYITYMTERKPLIGFMPHKPLSKNALKKTKKFLITSILLEEGTSRHLNPMKAIKDGMIPLIRRPILTGYYSEPDLSQPYLFFPFHVPFDAQITLRSYGFRKQDEAVKLISKALPENYLLYAKPHPHSIGNYPFSWLKTLAQLKNVRIIDPVYSAHSLIEHSKAIVTINSDVGWEAILYGKPVVTLGRPFYSGLGYTIDVSNLEDLPNNIQTALRRDPIPRSKIVKLVYAAYNSTVDGSYYKKGWEFNCDDDNINNIVNGIFSSYERYYQ
jgi:hypothetical protein